MNFFYYVLKYMEEELFVHSAQWKNFGKLKMRKLIFTFHNVKNAFGMDIIKNHDCTNEYLYLVSRCESKIIRKFFTPRYFDIEISGKPKYIKLQLSIVMSAIISQILRLENKFLFNQFIEFIAPHYNVTRICASYRLNGILFATVLDDVHCDHLGVRYISEITLCEFGFYKHIDGYYTYKIFAPVIDE